MKELIDYLSEKEKIKNKDLLEKDVVLHSLLCELQKNDYFKNNLVFKGGTCLAKCYYGYYRFSEDLDFSWIKQELFGDKSEKQIRRVLSAEITKICSILEEISKKIGLVFKNDKSDKNYVELGGSNKFATFKLWYKSEISGIEQFIKVQINFVELFVYSFKAKEAKTMLKNAEKEELEFLFPEHSECLFVHPKVFCYDIREILLEKVRAILTRKGVKAGDFIDVFMITERENINLEMLKPKIVEKIRFALRFEKYSRNFRAYGWKRLVIGEEEKLLLRPINKGFEDFLKKFETFLDELAEIL